jgi:hypothetical protein
MNLRSCSLIWIGLFALLLCGAPQLGAQTNVPTPTTPQLPGKEFKLVVQLVWCTNEEKSPDPNHKPVSAELEKKLKNQPFKWQHYFEVCSKTISPAEGGSQRVQLSRECVVLVRNLGGNEVEVTLLGKGEKVSKVKQKLPAGETLVQGGNAANGTGWFVVVRQAK